MPKSSAKKQPASMPADDPRPVGRPKGVIYPMPTLPSGRVLISQKRTAKWCGVHPLTLYRWLKNIPDFPRPIKLSPNRVAFFEDEIIAFIESRPRL